MAGSLLVGFGWYSFTTSAPPRVPVNHSVTVPFSLVLSQLRYDVLPIAGLTEVFTTTRPVSKPEPETIHGYSRLQEQGLMITAFCGACVTMKRGREPYLVVLTWSSLYRSDWPGVSAAIGANDAVIVEVDVVEFVPKAGTFSPRSMVSETPAGTVTDS